jgi:FMN reductase
VTELVVISGGLRQPSSTRLLADRLGEAVGAELTAGGDRVSTTVVELRPLARQITDALLSGYRQPELEAAVEAVAAADALIAVTPAFNASYSGLFKSFFDVLPEEALSDVPVLLAATGGTERHSLILDHALRPLFAYLRAVVAPTGVYAATADFGTGADGSSTLDERITRAARELVRLLDGRGPRQRRDAWADDVGAMERLLAGQPAGATEAARRPDPDG